MKMEWQPIATAPKDGRLILAFDANLRDDSKHAKFYYGAYKDDGHYYRGSMFEVVCWIPDERSQLVHVKGDTYKHRKCDWSHWARSQGSWQPTHWMPLPEPPK